MPTPCPSSKGPKGGEGRTNAVLSHITYNGVVKRCFVDGPLGVC
jgi:hypothetical protein